MEKDLDHTPTYIAGLSMWRHSFPLVLYADINFGPGIIILYIHTYICVHVHTHSHTHTPAHNQHIILYAHIHTV